MKILKVSFSNLNSLYGDWEINFDHPAYSNDGLFSITGPTGAGKSTILDAICLALYGRTPRLDSVGAQSNEIMSRQRAECMAEVTFETRNGTFRCSWSQHRARNRVDGNLVAAKHELINAETHEVLCNKKRDVAQAVEQHTGMNFDRFTRSMLLAQGQFAAFLTASADQRAPILEQITGTEIYSTISKTVHERRREHEELLSRLRDDAKAVQPLSIEQELQLERQLELSKMLTRGLDRRLHAIQEALFTAKKAASLHEEITVLHAQKHQLEHRHEHMSALKEQYRLALVALELEPLYQVLTSRKNEQIADRKLVTEEEHLISQIQQQISEKQRQVDAAGTEVQKARESWDHMQPMLAEAKEITHTYNRISARADGLRRELTTALHTRSSHSEHLETLRRNLREAEQVRDKIARWIAEHREDDELLAQSLEHIRLHLIQMRSVSEQVRTERHTYEDILLHKNQIETERDRINTLLNAALEDLEANNQEITACETRRKQLLGESSKQVYTRELGYLQEREVLVARIESLEDRRKQLIDGQPCPLCGSLDHPFSQHELPSLSETRVRLKEVSSIITQVEQCEDELRVLKDEHTAYIQQQSSLQATYDALLQQRDDVLLQEDRSQAKLKDREAELRKVQNLCMGNLESENDPLANRQRVEEYAAQLEQRQSQWEAQLQSEVASEQTVARIVHEVQEIRKRVIEAHDRVLKVREQVHAAREKISVLSQRLSVLLGDYLSIEDFDNQMKLQLADVEQKQQQKRDDLSQLQQSLALHEHARLSLTTRIEERNKNLCGHEAQFSKELEDHGIADETAFLQYRCDAASRLSMKEEIEDYDRQAASCESRLHQIANELKKLEQDESEAWPIPLLEEHQRWCESEKESMHRLQGGMKERLEENNRKRAQYNNQQEAIDKQQKVFHGYDRLNTFIGSHDGKKFRNFAQSLTFELLIAHANEHLHSLSDRYMLTPDADQPLDVAVIDLYQGAQVRSARNLSGGESFLVSLSLSLALSTIASKRVQVDSLFLDEGFGTLDEQTLETALSALSALRSQGKLVGIISHVGALQERIPVQISVIPIAGGVSRIEGPGCSAFTRSTM